jgi:hypothetical protein
MNVPFFLLSTKPLFCDMKLGDLSGRHSATFTESLLVKGLVMKLDGQNATLQAGDVVILIKGSHSVRVRRNGKDMKFDGDGEFSGGQDSSESWFENLVRLLAKAAGLTCGHRQRTEPSGSPYFVLFAG